MPERVRGTWRHSLGRWGLTMALVGGLAGCAQMGGGAAAPARVERLMGLFEQTVPIGWMVERVAARDPQWPLQQHPGKFTPTQLACTRSELTANKVAATQREDARVFARRYPERVEESIQVLEGGGTAAVSLLMRAGIDQGLSGQRADARALMSTLSAGQLRAFTELAEGHAYAELRQALRIDGMTGAGSHQTSRQRGFKVGQDLMIGPMLTAMERCRISPATLFDQAGAST